MKLLNKAINNNPRSELFREMGRAINERSSTPIYQQIASLFEKEIETGNLAPGDRLPPERELRNLIGVSRSTLRAALAPLIENHLLDATQGRGTFVLEPKQQKELRFLALERFSASHWSVAPVHYDWINDAAKATGSQIHYHYTPTLDDLFRVLAEPPSGCDGLIIFRAQPDWSEAIAKAPDSTFEQCPVPVMLIGRPIHKPGLNAVTFDYLAATRRVTESLIALGHRRIGFLGGKPVEGHSFTEFHQGYLDAMSEAKLPVFEEDIHLLGPEALQRGISPQTVVTEIADFLDKRSFTALVVTLFVVPFEEAIQRSRIVLPNDLSVMVVAEEHALQKAIRWSGVAEPSAQIVMRGVERLASVCRKGQETVYELFPPEEQCGGTCHTFSPQTA